MNLIKTVKSYAIYTMLCVCCFAFVYASIYWISKDIYWVVEMLETTHGRSSFAQIFVLTCGLCWLVCFRAKDIIAK